MMILILIPASQLPSQQGGVAGDEGEGVAGLGPVHVVEEGGEGGRLRILSLALSLPCWRSQAVLLYRSVTVHSQKRRSFFLCAILALNASF